MIATNFSKIDVHSGAPISIAIIGTPALCFVALATTSRRWFQVNPARRPKLPAPARSNAMAILGHPVGRAAEGTLRFPMGDRYQTSFTGAVEVSQAASHTNGERLGDIPVRALF